MRIVLRLLPAPVLLVALLIAALVPTSAPAAGRITNGQDVSDGIYQSHLQPLVALVDLSAPSQYDGQFCAGTLIDEYHVLSAAHCIVDSEGGVRTRIAPSTVGILAGTRSLNENALNRTSLVRVTAIYTNPNFNINTMRWDAAVLRLATPITTVPVSPRLTDADVAALGMGSAEVNAIIAGWGDTNPNVDGCCFPSVLKYAQIPVRTTTICEQNLASADALSFDPEFQFCAGRLATRTALGADTCQGDSGGPLFVDVNGVPKHAGVTSFGFGCGQRYFGVYARTTALAGWLDSIPGVPAGDTRDAANGPGDSVAPTVTATPLDYRRAKLTITPPATGTPVTQWTVWVKTGASTVAVETYKGKATSTTFNVLLNGINRLRTFTVLVKPYNSFGDGNAATVQARPKVDSIRPTVPRGLRISRSGAFVTLTWNASVDRQSGVAGYAVQRKIRGVWRAPAASVRRSFRFRAGTSHGAIRVLGVDWASNLSGYSAAVRY